MDVIRNKKQIDRVAKVNEIYGKLAREIAVLKKEYQKLEEKEKFFRAEAVLHLAELSQKGNDQSYVISNQKLMLHKGQSDILRKQVDCLKKCSALEITHIEGKAEVVDYQEQDYTQDITSLMSSRSQKDKKEKEKEKSIMKTIIYKGKIGQFKVSTEIVSQHLVGYIRKEREVPNVDISPIPDCLLLMYQAFLPFDPWNLKQFMNSIHYYEILKEEREKTVTKVEDIVQAEITKTTESWIIRFSPALDLFVSVVWRIIFNKLNLHIQHKLAITCPEEVLAFYSKKKEIYQYLSTQKALKTSSDVIKFFKSFN
ncbi:uncharacterized protein [Palaemon carinicauda]|uniref:uncharacterized protein n=1 Tax=Palaemon carinicauda TaxID=392227 RepID=UPI0035B611A5